MDPSLDPLFGQRLDAQAAGLQALSPAALHALLATNQRPQAFPQQQQQQQQPFPDPLGVQPAPASINLFSQLLGNTQLAQLQGVGEPAVVQSERPTSSRGTRRSGGQGGGGGAPQSYASRHQQAEARRRSRINERLEALRKVVPHSERANTATFLEDVLKYVQRLERRVAELEREAGLEPTVKCLPPPRLTDAEPSSLTGATSENLVSRSQQLQQAQQAQQQQQQGSRPEGVAEQLTGLARAGLLAPRARGAAAAGGSDLPSASEELAMAEALQPPPPRGGSVLATPGTMAESSPLADTAAAPAREAALVQLAQQAQQAPPGGLPLSGAGLAGGIPRRGPNSGPSSSELLRAAQELTAAAAAARASEVFAAQQPSAYLQAAAQTLLGATSGASQSQSQGLALALSAQQALLGGLPSQLSGSLGSASLGGLCASQQPAASDPTLQLQQLLAAQQNMGVMPPHLAPHLGLTAPKPATTPTLPTLPQNGGASAPSASAPTPGLPAAPAGVLAPLAKELSNSGRSQQTQHGTPGAGGGGTVSEDVPANGDAAGAKRPAEVPPAADAKRRRLPERPTASA